MRAMTYPKSKYLTMSSALLACLVFSNSGQAQADPIEGSWRGSGIMKPSLGDKEKVRCKIRYSKQADKVFSFIATCAATSGNFSQCGEVNRAKGNRYIGTFYNSKNSATGRIRVGVNGSRQNINISSNKSSGGINLSKRQAIRLHQIFLKHRSLSYFFGKNVIGHGDQSRLYSVLEEQNLSFTS